MNVDARLVGQQIGLLRKRKGLTQAELGEQLGVSFQAVSNWERGETLPDIGILLDLAEVLETTTDFLLTGGKAALPRRRRIQIADMREGLNCLRRMGELLGRENLIYRSAVAGIDGAMNTRIEEAFRDGRILECFVAEAVIQNLKAGGTVDRTEVQKEFREGKYRDIVLSYAERYA